MEGEPATVVEDLGSRRLAKCLEALQKLREAQARLDTPYQLKASLELLKYIGVPSDSGQASALADALNFAVDALCNVNRTGDARRLADEIAQLVYDLEPNRWRLARGPKTLPAYRVASIRARAIELDGDPDDAMRRCLALRITLAKATELGDRRVDLVSILRNALSSAKREGSQTARRFADQARNYGDRIALELETTRSAEVAASYWHRAAIERRSRGGAGANEEAIKMFERSLSLRPSTPRDLKSRGMAIGDLHVLRGDRQTGALILTQTLKGFIPALPRHYDSAFQQLAMRDLLVAA